MVDGDAQTSFSGKDWLHLLSCPNKVAEAGQCLIQTSRAHSLDPQENKNLGVHVKRLDDNPEVRVGRSDQSKVLGLVYDSLVREVACSR